MKSKLMAAFGAMGLMQKAYTPPELKAALLEMSEELDRLRAEVDELRSKQPKE